MRHRGCLRVRAIVVILTAAFTTLVAQRAPLTGAYERGSFTLTFTADGKYLIARGGTPVVEGMAQADGDQLTVRDTSGSMACEADVSGHYKWRLEQDVLTLAVIDDACKGRASGLGSGSWTRRKNDRPLALVGATLIDGTGTPGRANSVLVINGGRITDLFSAGEKPVPADAAVVRLEGRWIVPGLIDAHVHLATEPDGSDNRADVQRKLQRALLGGVTAVRDMGGDVRVLGDLARSANLQLIPSPAIWYSALIGGPSFFDDPRVRASTRGARAGALPWAHAVTPGADYRLVVAEAKGSGAQALKLYAGLPAEVLRPLTEEAHRQGMKVWSHAALFPARPRDAIAAGVDVLSHAALLIWEMTETVPDYTQRYAADYGAPAGTQLDGLLKEMAARGTMLEPTLHVVFGPGSPDARARWSADVSRRAQQLGVRLVAGTDGIGAEADGELPNIHRELELLVREAGLSPLDALVAATGNAARALGIEDSRGTLAIGKAADVVVLNADPLTNIKNTSNIACVLRGGRIYSTQPANGAASCAVDGR